MIHINTFLLVCSAVKQQGCFGLMKFPNFFSPVFWHWINAWCSRKLSIWMTFHCKETRLIKQYLNIVYLIKYLWLVEMMIFTFSWKHYACRRMLNGSKCLHMLTKNVEPSPVTSNEESTPALSSPVLIVQGKLNHSANLSLNKEAGEVRKVCLHCTFSCRGISLSHLTVVL